MTDAEGLVYVARPRDFAGEKPGEFVAPHGCVVDSGRDLYVAEVAWTAKGSLENPPREVRSLQKFERVS